MRLAVSNLALRASIGLFTTGVLAAGVSPDPSGRWEVTTTVASGSYVAGLNLTRNDSGYEGEGGYLVPSGDFPFRYTGSERSDGLHLQILGPTGNTPIGELLLTEKPDGLKGAGHLYGLPIAVSARRPLLRPASAPRLHVFEPQQFYGNFSGAIPPALHIFPGDTVQTKTVDCNGDDEHGVHRTLASNNPQTGPFYIEGAMVGDTIAVHFTKIRPNRDTAVQWRGSINAHAMPSDYRQHATEDWSMIWDLDREHGTARPERPSEKLKGLVIKLSPMLGTVAVAPDHFESYESGHSGRYGGNMDYHQIREGVTLYLPVLQAGALLTFGDGHAVQGDGEITGQGLETSMDVEFSVELLKDKLFVQPWAEDDEYVMVSGISQSLQEALQFATGGLANWLKTTYQLDSSEAATVLANSIHYDIAEVVDWDLHVVAKIPKAQLAQLQKPESPATLVCFATINCTGN
ncbi:MAG TPA: acetamidase/formamidase family protein [Steroidobacteraceae bacterium]|jgi:amidase|nr:acetamidase/formamidase family protein [Steroidobacteraceae bacterium]